MLISSWWGRYFQMFLFYLEIVNRMRQISITISGFTHSIKKPCGRGDIKFIWQFTALSFQNLLNAYWKMWKMRSKHASCWNHNLRCHEAAQIFFYQFIISLCLMREVKIRFISFSVFQFIFENFDWGREVYHFMDLKMGTRELTQI